MATRAGANLNKTHIAGVYGNQSVALIEEEFVADAASTLVELAKLSGAITIYEVIAKTDDMGSAQTMDIGFNYIDSDDGTSDPDHFFDGIDTGTAAATNVWYGNKTIADGKGIKIVAQNLGDAATGTLILIVKYVYRGNV